MNVNFHLVRTRLFSHASRSQKKRGGELSREISPSLSDFLKVWSGFQTTTPLFRYRFRTHEQSPPVLHSSVTTPL